MIRGIVEDDPRSKRLSEGLEPLNGSQVVFVFVLQVHEERPNAIGGEMIVVGQESSHVLVFRRDPALQFFIEVEGRGRGAEGGERGVGVLDEGTRAEGGDRGQAVEEHAGVHDGVFVFLCVNCEM